MARSERGTCSICRRVRKLVGPDDPRPAWRATAAKMREKNKYSSEARKLEDKADRHYHHHYLCGECTALSPEERQAEKDRGEQRVKERNLKARKAYPIVGGPLDGERAITADFDREWISTNPKWSHEAGMYAHLADEYVEYNSAGGGGPSMIFVHVSCLQRTTHGRER